MASQNQIANWALDLMGEPHVDDITDAVERAELLLAAWDSVRDNLLRQKTWRFSIQRASLAVHSSTPAWGFSYQYQIAADVVRVVQVDQYYPPAILSDQVGSDTAYFHIEGDKILTNLSAPLKVRWAVNSVDVGLWDPCFAQVMACDLAERLAPRATGSEAMLNRIAAQRSQAMGAAQRVNAIETPPRMINDGSWVVSRFQA